MDRKQAFEKIFELYQDSPTLRTIILRECLLRIPDLDLLDLIRQMEEKYALTNGL